MKIKKAKPQDIKKIWSLYQAFVLDNTKVENKTYAAKVQKQGFTLGLNDQKGLLKRIRTSQIFNVMVDALK